MFGNGGNAFGALGMEDDQPTAGPSTRLDEGEESDVDWLKLVKTNHDIDVRVSDRIELEGLPTECNLMVVSNIWDLLIVGSNNDVRIHRLSKFHQILEGAIKDASPVSEPIQNIELSDRPVWIKLAMNEEKLVVATANGAGFHLFKLRDVLSGNTNPYHSFTSDIPSQLLDVLPNPAPSIADQQARYVTLLAKEGLVIADIEDCKLSTPLPGPFSCASWSARGKQIVVGIPSGKLVQYTPEGVAKAEIPSPPDLDAYYPVFVQWLENDLFFVSYALEGGQPDDPVETYTIYRNKGEFTFTKFFDPLNTMGLMTRASTYRHFAGLKSWGERTKHLAMIVSGASSEIGLLHGNTVAEKEPPKWEVLMLEETARGVLPASKSGVRDDASVLALALDLTSTKIIQQGIVGGIELPDLPPQPRLLAYTQEGIIISFDVRYSDAGPYPGMITPQDITNATAIPSQGLQATPSQTATTPATPSFNNATSTSSSASSGRAFGSSGFGQSPTPAFASSSKPAAFGASGFGQSSTPASSPAPATPSAFGSTSKPAAFGGFGQSSTSAGFGQSAFGQPSKPSAFGAPPAPSAFGSSSTPTSTPVKASAFAATSTPTSAFGSASKPTAFGATSTPTSSFGNTSSPASGFGQSAFGQSSRPASSTPSAFASSSTPSALGTSSSSSNTTPAFSGFGTANKSSTGFGTSAFGQTAKSAEKKDSASSPFGSGGSAFGSASAFGNSSAFGSSTAFGQSAFGQKPLHTPTAPVEASNPAFTGFGSKPDGQEKPSSAFSGFGQKPTTTLSPSSEAPKSAFGSFGSKPAQSSAFGAFGQSTPSPSIETTTNTKEDDFGLSGFASVLESTTKPSEVPDSPPTSPVIGTVKQPSGLEDETPPNSPPMKPSASKPANATTPSSSFIKPATAFGSAPSQGSFGQASKPSAPAFGAGSTPAALSTPPAPSPSAFGATGFGKPSTIGAASTSAFGVNAFGQSSVPAGFGKTTIPASSKPIGSITGGFGSFGAISDGGDKKSTGFGGFASTGSSVFGGDTDKEKKSTGFGGFGTQGASSTFASSASKEKQKEKPSSVFSTIASPSVFSFNPKPTETPAAAEKSTAPSTPEEETKGYDVPTSAAESKEETTTPTATPSKNKVEEKTSVSTGSTSTQSDALSQPTQTPAKPTTPFECTTPSAEPTEVTQPIPSGDGPHKAATVKQSSDLAQKTDVVAEPESADQDDQEEQEEDEQQDYDVSRDEEEYDEEDYEGEYEGEEGDVEEYDDDYDDEEYEVEEVDVNQGRRRSTSIPPDMSPIKEEVSDELASDEGDEQQESENGYDYEEEDSQAVTSKSLTKSPPTWFAKPTKDDKVDAGPVSPTPTSEGTSLFSRLGPPPLMSSSSTSQQEAVADQPVAPISVHAQPKLPQSFSFKHATRTSSPLTNPPENASTTPESSPAKPPASSGLFGAKPAEPANEEEKKVSTLPSLGLFGAKPTQPNSQEEKKPDVGAFNFFGTSNSLIGPPPLGANGSEAKLADIKADTKPPPAIGFSLFGDKPSEIAKGSAPLTSAPGAGGFSLFGNKSTEPSKTDTPPSLFGAAKTIPPVAIENAKPSFGLGLGKPGPFVPTSTVPTQTEKKPSSSGTSTPAVPPTQASIPSVKPAPPAKFTLPTREVIPRSPAPSSSQTKTLAGVIEKIIVSLNDDIKHLTKVLNANAKYHQSFNIKDLSEVTAVNLPANETIAFSAIGQLTDIVEDLTKELSDRRNNDNVSELKLAELQSRMLKTDMKVGQADKFLRARQDPSFAKVMQVKDLSPEQASSQLKLRKSVQIAETKIEELDASIAGLRRRAERQEQGRINSQQPALERVQRSVRNIDAAIRDRQQTIDDLARRIGSIRLSSPSRAGSPGPSISRSTPRKPMIPSTTTTKAINLEPSKEVLAEVEASLTNNSSKISSRIEKMKFAKLTKMDNRAEKQKPISHKGPVLIDALPLPGQLPPLPPSVNKPSKSVATTTAVPTSTKDTLGVFPSTPSLPTAGNTSTPSPSFGGIKFNLDPGNISDLARSSTHRGGGAGGGGGGGSTRTHTPAAKFIPSSNPPNSASPAAGGLFDFKNDNAKKDDEKGKPSGFFSFSGFGPK
ncbi:uncharacterized protein IL334_002137 [Kwoniella shivajii]|uniref:Nucleoporin Nup159/Nup146 N-terminal domain-containing protein n=1 Tax=Kwoniella shivajii TaxID=564305 RepID=A0ABZ1CVI7_9TREE|nr:hypothetical protein IL334_002137 [Kwoniella shivajii]